MDSKHSTAHFEDAANITVNSISLISQEKQSGDEEDFQVNPYVKNEGNKSNEENTS